MKRRTYIIGIVGVLVIAGLWVVLFVSPLGFLLGFASIGEKSEGFYSPIWSEDGTEIYFIKRFTKAKIEGGSIVPFTGKPSVATIKKEQFYLIAKNIDTGRERILVRFKSPRIKTKGNFHIVRDVKADLTFNDDRTALNYILLAGKTFAGRGQVAIDTRATVAGSLNRVGSSDPLYRIPSTNPHTLHGNRELLRGAYRYQSAIIIFDHDDQNMTIFEKDSFGEFDRQRLPGFSINDIQTHLQKDSVNRYQRSEMNRAIRDVLSTDFRENEQAQMRDIQTTLAFIYEQKIESGRFNFVEEDPRWECRPLNGNRMLVRYELDGRQENNLAEWIVANKKVIPNNGLAEEISYYQYSKRDFWDSFRSMREYDMFINRLEGRP